MPELPDVETFKRYMDATSLHQRIAGVKVESPRVLEHITPEALRRKFTGHAFTDTLRRGKYLFARLDSGGWAVFHFGMTGGLAYFDGATAPRYTQVLFDFENGRHLAYLSRRKLGRVGFTEDLEASLEAHQLGPDALALTFDEFKALGRERTGAVKCWLMDQATLAGLGNIYSDEILFQAQLHPKRALDSLTSAEWKTLYKATRSVLETAIAKGADPNAMPRSYLLPRRKKGEACPRCGGRVETINACGRQGYYCPKCQQG